MDLKKIFGVALALFLFSGVGFAEELFSIQDSDPQNALSVLSGGTETSASVDASAQILPPDGALDELVDLSASIMDSVSNGICTEPTSLSESAQCLLRLADDTDFFSFRQAIFLRSVADGDLEETKLFAALNPDLLEKYATVEEKSQITSLDMSDYDVFTFVDSKYPDITHQKGWASLQEQNKYEFDELLEKAISEDFVSENTALRFALAQQEPDALAYFAKNHYSDFKAFASDDELQLASHAFAVFDHTPTLNNVTEKHFTVLEEIHDGAVDEPYSKPAHQRLDQFTKQEYGFYISDVIGVGAVCAYPLVALTTGLIVADLPQANSMSIPPLATEVAASAAAVSFISAVGMSEHFRSRDFNINPNKYSSHESNIMIRELAKDIEEQEVVD